MTARRSIRVQVTAAATAVAAAVLTAVAGLVVWRQHDQALDALDASLSQRAAALAPGLDADSTTAPGDDDRVTQVLDRAGEVLAASPGLAGVGPLTPPVAAGRPPQRVTRSLPVDEGDYRLVVRGNPDGTTLVVGESTDDLDDATATLVRTLALVVPGAVVALGALVWWAVGRTLRPVEELRSEVARITLEDLDRPVPDPGTGDEIAGLAQTLESMRSRLAAARDRERAFIDDASHELRTPLTRLAANLELAAGDADEAVAAARGGLGDVRAMASLVDDLLFLARSDHGTAGPTRPIDLAEVVRLRVRTAGDRSGVAVELAETGPAVVDGDERRLGRVVDNLLDNATRHATSKVEVAVGTVGGDVELTVDDDGPGIPAGERERIFERFARIDDARSRHEGGTGLGLAIVAEITHQHRGTVRADRAPGGGARLCVRLPGVSR